MCRKSRPPLAKISAHFYAEFKKLAAIATKRLFQTYNRHRTIPTYVGEDDEWTLLTDFL